MARYRSPFYGDPNIAAIATNLTRAFVDSNPGQTAYYKEGARERKIKADEAQRQYESRARRAAMISRVAGAFDPTQAGEYVSLSILDGSGGETAAKDALAKYSLAGLPDRDRANAYVGAGKAIRPYDAFSEEGERKQTTRKEGAEMARTATSASIAASASRANNADTIKQRESEFVRTGQSDVGKALRDRDTLTLSPADRAMVEERARRAAYGDPQSPVGKAIADRNRTGTMTPGQEQTTDDYIKSLVRPGPTSALAKLIAERDALPQGDPKRGEYDAIIKRTTEGPTSPATPKVVDDLEWQILQEIKASDPKDVYSPAFREKYAERLEDARRAMADTYQATKNAARAKEAYLRTLGVEPGSTWDSGGGFLGFGRREPGMVAPKPKPGGAGEAIRGGPSAAPMAPRAAGPDPGAALQQAREAIAKGANPDQVKQRLKSMGVDPSGL